MEVGKFLIIWKVTLEEWLINIYIDSEQAKLDRMLRTVPWGKKKKEKKRTVPWPKTGMEFKLLCYMFAGSKDLSNNGLSSQDSDQVLSS